MKLFFVRYWLVLSLVVLLIGGLWYDMRSAQNMPFVTQSVPVQGPQLGANPTVEDLLQIRSFYGSLKNYIAHITMLPLMYTSSGMLGSVHKVGSVGNNSVFIKNLGDPIVPIFTKKVHDPVVPIFTKNANDPVVPTACIPGACPTDIPIGINNCGDGSVMRPNTDGLWEECDGEYALDAEGNPTRLCNQTFCCIDESPVDGICDCHLGFDPLTGMCKTGGEQTNTCGDGRVYVGEECDDGNTNNLDNCNNACKLTACVIDYCPTDPKEHGYDPTCETDTCSDFLCNKHPSCVWKTTKEFPSTSCNFIPHTKTFGGTSYISDYIDNKYNLLDEFDTTTEYLFIDFLNPNCTAESVRVGEKVLNMIDTWGDNNRCKFVGLVENFADKNAYTFAPPLDIQYLRNIDSGTQVRNSLGLQPIAGTEYIAIMKYDGTILFEGNEDQVDEYLAAMQRLCTPCTVVDDTDPIDGACGWRHDTSIYDNNLSTGPVLTKNSQGLCNAGTPISFTYNASSYQWKWECMGDNGGNTAMCNAYQLYCGDAERNGTEACDADDLGVCTVCASDCTCDDNVSFDCNKVTDISPQECEVLVALYTATDGDQRKDATNWLVSEKVDDRFGITVENGFVQTIDLENNNLTGPIPVELGTLANLRVLKLARNKLTGLIPETLGNLANLAILHLGSNDLSGPIPQELGDLANLEILDLSSNNVSGLIPETLSTLANLASLNLSSNKLTGPIPQELGDLTNLVSLNLSSNTLTGLIPVELGDLTKLVSLNLSSNTLTGLIPGVLGTLTNLRILDLSSNKLSGPIPVELGTLANLRILYLDFNELSGSIPESLGNLGNVERLHLNANELTGPIPKSLGNLNNLLSLYLNFNALTGPIPEALGNLGNIERLHFSSNEYVGVVPDFLKVSQKLYINGTNTICGEVPASLVPILSDGTDNMLCANGAQCNNNDDCSSKKCQEASGVRTCVAQLIGGGNEEHSNTSYGE